MPLKLDPSDAVFVVFRAASAHSELMLSAPQRQLLTSLHGPWQVSFAAGQAAPARASFEQLTSWTQNADPGIRYFSGTASYAQTLPVPRDWLSSHTRLELDLGSVKNLASVRLNGRDLAVLWKAPFRLDITDAVHAGDKALQIAVTNTWVNRLIGDQQPGAKQYAWASFEPYKADSTLLDSGLLGPVQLWQITPAALQR